VPDWSTYWPLAAAEHFQKLNPCPAQGCRYRRGCLKHLEPGLASRMRAGKLQKLFSSYLGWFNLKNRNIAQLTWLGDVERTLVKADAALDSSRLPYHSLNLASRKWKLAHFDEKTASLLARPAAERKRCASINFDAFVELELS
jgi:hypothetical protein